MYTFTHLFRVAMNTFFSALCKCYLVLLKASTHEEALPKILRLDIFSGDRRHSIGTSRSTSSADDGCSSSELNMMVLPSVSAHGLLYGCDGEVKLLEDDRARERIFWSLHSTSVDE